MMTQFFEKWAKQPKLVIGVGVAVLLLLVGFGIYSQTREKSLEVARQSFFNAQTLLSQEQNKARADGNQDKKGKKFQVPFEYKKLDVKKTYPKSIPALEKVVETHPATPSAFLAAMALAELYFNHQDEVEAQTWFKKAEKNATQALDRTSALLGQGTLLENQSQFKSALEIYREALNAGSQEALGEVLMGIGRVQAKLGNTNEAKTVYDRIINELKDSQYVTPAKTAKKML